MGTVRLDPSSSSGDPGSPAPAPAPPLTFNPDGLWRSYFGSGQFHHYNVHQLNAAWHHQVADCGKETRTATGNFSPFRPELHKDMRVCAKCRRINLAPNQ
jgi:hypothetical protein